MLMVTRSCMKSPRHIFGMNRRRLLCSLLWPVILRFANLIETKIDEQTQWIKKSKESFDSFKYLEVESFVFSSKRICQFYHLQMLEVSPKHEELPTSYGSNPSAAGVLCTMVWCQSSNEQSLGFWWPETAVQWPSLGLWLLLMTRTGSIARSSGHVATATCCTSGLALFHPLETKQKKWIVACIPIFQCHGPPLWARDASHKSPKRGWHPQATALMEAEAYVSHTLDWPSAAAVIGYQKQDKCVYVQVFQAKPYDLGINMVRYLTFLSCVPLHRFGVYEV